MKLDFWFLNSNEYFDDVRTEIGYFWQIQGIRDAENGLNQFRTIVSIKGNPAVYDRVEEGVD